MRFYKQNTDDAVSPVIGVILMVAVTVILAAVIGTFILGLGDNVQENPQAAVSFTENTNDDEVEVLIISTGNVDTLTLVKDDDAVFEGNPTSDEGVSFADAAENELRLDNPSVGDSFTLQHTGGDAQIVLTGVVNGNEAVIQVEPYDFS